MSLKLSLRTYQQLRKLSEFVHKTPSKIKTESVPVSQYGGRHIVTMLPGSGIGPEMTQHVRDVFTTAQIPVDFEVIEGSGEELVKNATLSLGRNRVGIKGNLENVINDEGFIAPNVVLRAKLDLFVFVVHYKASSELRSKFPNLDLVIIRQNTEGEYAMLEHESVKGMVESMKIITRDNTQRLAKFAFEYARDKGRKKVTVVHKSKQLALSDGMFLQTTKEVAESYPDIQLENIYIDRCCQKLVKNPHNFDILLMPNLYGTILSNIACGLAGGAGLYAGTNYGSNLAIFETATRHTGKTLIGYNSANPVAMLTASINMLQHLGRNEHAQLINDAIYYTLSAKNIKTPDLGGTNTTSEVVSSIKDFIKDNLHKYKNKF